MYHCVLCGKRLNANNFWNIKYGVCTQKCASTTMLGLIDASMADNANYCFYCGGNFGFYCSQCERN